MSYRKADDEVLLTAWAALYGDPYDPNAAVVLASARAIASEEGVAAGLGVVIDWFMETMTRWSGSRGTNPAQTEEAIAAEESRLEAYRLVISCLREVAPEEYLAFTLSQACGFTNPKSLIIWGFPRPIARGGW